MTALAIAALTCAIWIYLLVGRGGFWRLRERDDIAMPCPEPVAIWPSVVAIVPARDEAAVIGASIGTLLRQDYRGTLDVVVVDDHSGDGTVAAVHRSSAARGSSARVTVLAAPRLPVSWTGKLWAMHQGATHAQEMPAPPDYLLFTDADIHYDDNTLTDLVRLAVRDNLVLTSLMARLRCDSFAERALIPAFVFFFQMLYPFAWARSAGCKTAAAAGGCMLVQRRALVDAGGLEAIRGELIDDCALARLLKRKGAIWLGLTKRVSSVRAYPAVPDIRRMVTRCAYAQLRFQPALLAVATVAMMLTFLAPPLLAFFGAGAAQLLGSLAWALMALAFQPILRFYGISPYWGAALPAIAGLYLAFTVDSAWHHVRGRGVEWKGRLHRGTSISQ